MKSVDSRNQALDGASLLPKNGITAILFDFDGTLRHSFPLASDFFTDFVVSKNYPISNDDRLRGARWEHYYWANSPELQADLQEYKDDSEAFWCYYAYRRLIVLGLEKTNAKIFGPEACKHMNDSYEHENVIPPELPGVLETLQKAGYRMGVVSNRNLPYWEELVEFNLCPFFEFSLAAGEVQSWKPSSGIFHAAVDRVDSQAAQTLYVGDNYFADVVGARRAGLQPVLYDPKGIFHEPGCPVLTTFNDLLKVVSN